MSVSTGAELLHSSPYQAYTYSYPHKTAYRALEPPEPLDALWSAERRDALFLYIHIPFCGMRCGFCNLFTRARPDDGLVARYLAALRRQAARVRDALGDVRFARFAVGGGTPTYLSVHDLESVLDLADGTMGADLMTIPGSVEASPDSVDGAKLGLLRDRGVDRISIGVETFDESEALAVYRPQRSATVHEALEQIRAAGVPTLNIDLIYGLPGQTVESWLRSVQAALEYRPEELYLYPLYVRPLTGLGRSRREWDDLRLACYREGRALLSSEGYSQISMRQFRARHSVDAAGPVYCCQDDGMVGLGCGARSYTSALHYGTEYAVGAHPVRAIIESYTVRADATWGLAEYGFQLDDEDQRRRYVIQSLLSGEGLPFRSYDTRFGSHPLGDFPELAELCELGLAAVASGSLELTDAGMERSDAIGPWLYSRKVIGLMEDFAWH